MRNYFLSGGWNVICDSCGFKKKSNEVRKRWDGLIVCSDTCWEPDHPQKFIRVRTDGLVVPFIRDDPTPAYLDVCYIYESCSYSGLSSSGCWRSGIYSPSYSVLLQLKQSGLGN